MKLTKATSAKERARQAFLSWAISESKQWGWDAACQMIAEVMGYTKARTEAERVVLRYASGVGWPTVLQDLAALMVEHGCYLDVFCNRESDPDEDDDQPVSADAVREDIEATTE